MSKEKQIEEMARYMCGDCADYGTCKYGDICEGNLDVATALYNAGYRKQSGWISVEERLPDAQGHFLIVDKEGQMNTAFYSLRFGWFSDFRKKNITHWMPLPEAPKGGAGL